MYICCLSAIPLHLQQLALRPTLIILAIFIKCMTDICFNVSPVKKKNRKKKFTKSKL